jgi:NAD(P)-dependent dehydrogenase (short-subunit alcohol dehydrogenase family)
LDESGCATWADSVFVMASLDKATSIPSAPTVAPLRFLQIFKDRGLWRAYTVAQSCLTNCAAMRDSRNPNPPRLRNSTRAPARFASPLAHRMPIFMRDLVVIRPDDEVERVSLMPTPDFPRGAAIVLGGSGGVGRAVCARLAEAGADVALTYRSNEAAAAEVVAAVRALGRKAELYRLSAADSDAVRAFVDDVATQFGGVHTVVAAAGSDIPMRFVSEVSPATWREVIDADTNGFFYLAQAAIPHLRKSRGSLVAVTSAGIYRFPNRDILSVAPKAAIEALVRAVAKEEGRFGVRANSVALGVVDAGIFTRLQQGELPPEWIEAARRNTPMRRFGTADEVADAVVFLASARASYVTGQSLVLDGGYSL